PFALLLLSKPGAATGQALAKGDPLDLLDSRGANPDKAGHLALCHPLGVLGQDLTCAQFHDTGKAPSGADTARRPGLRAGGFCGGWGCAFVRIGCQASAFKEGPIAAV